MLIWEKKYSNSTEKNNIEFETDIAKSLGMETIGEEETRYN